jgi:cyanophycinase
MKRYLAPLLVALVIAAPAEAAFVWMCSRAKGGDFLVVRATGTDAYSPYIQALCPNAHSVATVIVNSVTAANDPVNVPTWIWPR